MITQTKLPGHLTHFNSTKPFQTDDEILHADFLAIPLAGAVTNSPPGDYFPPNCCPARFIGSWKYCRDMKMAS